MNELIDQIFEGSEELTYDEIEHKLSELLTEENVIQNSLLSIRLEQWWRGERTKLLSPKLIEEIWLTKEELI